MTRARKRSRAREFFNVDVEIVELSPQVIDRATRLRATFGLRTPGAIQAACAMSLRCRTILMTGDDSFRKVDGLEVIIV